MRGVADPDAQPVCYKALGAPMPEVVGVQDRFGAHTFNLSRGETLCVPSTP